MRARSRRRLLRLAEPKPAIAADFRDPESQRAISAMTVAWVRALGREAANEYFDQLIGKRKKVS